jgi:predicted phosphodiesterase
MKKTKPASRIGLIGDVHSEDELLFAALTRLSERDVELLLCVGDVADGAGDLDRTVELLREHAVLTVAGNHDRWLLEGAMRDLPDADALESLSQETRAFLGGLPKTRDIATPFGPALLCHGLGESDMACVRPDDDGYALEVNADLHRLVASPDVNFVFNGHTHRKMVRHFQGLSIVNAGTLHRDYGPGAVLIDFEAATVEWIPLTADVPAEPEPLGTLRDFTR